MACPTRESMYKIFTVVESWSFKIVTQRAKSFPQLFRGLRLHGTIICSQDPFKGLVIFALS